MIDFPSDIADQSQNITAGLFDKPTDKDFIKQLNDKGFELHAGLTRDFAESVMQMAREPAIREYCPNDIGSRFTDLGAVTNWLKKGRAVFILARREGELLSPVGYGWAGKGTSHHVPGGEITFAVRIAEAGQGQGMATPFSRLIIAAASRMHEASNFWLETWASNAAAVHVYHKIGFLDVAQEAGERPTTAGGNTADTRLFMSLPNEVL